MQDIGQKAGVTGPAIYRHFSGKQALFAEVYQWAAGELIGSAIKRAESLDPADAALELLQAHAHMCAYRPKWVRAWMTVDGHLPKALARATRDQMREYVGHWRDAIAALRPDLPEDQQSELASLVRGALSGTAWYGTSLPPAASEAMLVQAGLAVLYRTPAVLVGTAGAAAATG